MKKYWAQRISRSKYEVDLIDQIWEDRPSLSKKPCFFLEDKYTGENVASKLKRVREKMAEYGATVHLIASLDDNAWLLNFRGDELTSFPLVLDYVIVRKDSVDLYIDDSKLNDRIREEMAKNNVNIHHTMTFTKMLRRLVQMRLH